MTPRVKICCISSPEEARMAIDHGASALGLVSEMPSGPGVIGDELIAEIAAQIPPPIASFLLTSRTDADAIVEHVRNCRTNTVQFVDAVASGVYDRLRKELPALKIVQVIHVIDDDSIAEARGLSKKVDALLLDSGNPTLQVKQLGGTGRVHDWSLSRRIVEEARCPVFLAGGINRSNVGRAIREVRPYGLDLCSSVRSDHKLDADKLRGFFGAVKAA
ncbi:phosphoribosylanthranilate isomerase [Denitrobaculum tricleocarpae]|uniref:N-(5'-phosphoribosyl)anthranilate isomerase n=1 Tax=Denitrobaculum tricleocarpae TaxID=2591009 RepID=A0A545TP60_9PROT|nr:phosphoribosylanthranilate isomerase [Denitrobaculum tricleocarpae]TQV79007.1 phosphoribosylanthranilate isomerase [Denitrobaculum tricleocarpae]